MTRPDCILQPGFKPLTFPDVTCLGSLSPAEVYTIDNPLDWDKGSEWTARADFLSEDAVIVAISLNTLGWKSSLITNRLGNDILGENVVAELRRLGIEGEFVLDPSIDTPYEIVISDKNGGRTYLWKRKVDVLSTMEESDLSVMTGSKFVYADAYDWPYNAPGLKQANNLGIPVLLNMEDLAYIDKCGLDVYSIATTVQVSLTGDLSANFLFNWVDEALAFGVRDVIITRGEQGAYYISKDVRASVSAPNINLVDGNGAGAIFASGFLSGYLNNMSPTESVKFGVAVSSLSCERAGTDLPDLDKINTVFKHLKLSTL